MDLRRPRVLVNFASTIDGKTAPSRALRWGSLVLSRHPEDPRRMRALRASADAILIGAQNLRVDDPDLALAPEEKERRSAAGEREPLRMVLTRRGAGLSPQQKMFNPALGGPSFVVHTEEMPAQAGEQLAKVAHLISLSDLALQSVDIPRMLHWMAQDLGVRTLLCEGGGVICGQLFAARAVDQLFVTFVPRILGGSDAPTLADGAGFLPDQIPDATLGSLERIGEELFLRYDFAWS